MEQMERMNQLSEFWNWLPAFRAVAETEHLGDASERAYTSSSALSRSVRLLEDHLGHELFDRSGRNIRLNERGERFLRYVRSAMRLIDEGYENVTDSQHIGDVYVGAMRRLEWALRPLLDHLADRKDTLQSHLEFLDAPHPTARLLQGQLDLYVTHDPPSHAELETLRIGAYQNTLVAAADHPLADAPPDSPDDFDHIDFVAPDSAGDSTARSDGWPGHVSRNIVIDAGDLAAERRLCRRGDLLAVLPRPVADDGLGDDFITWTPEFLETTPMYAVRRRQVIEDDLVSPLVEVLTDSFGTPIEEQASNIDRSSSPG